VLLKIGMPGFKMRLESLVLPRLFLLGMETVLLTPGDLA